MYHVETVKIHDLRSGEDDPHGTNVLVDRMWPRGVAKDDVDLAAWLRDVAPSPDLRKWFDHEKDKFPAFSKKYRAELGEHAEELESSSSEDLSDAAKDLDTLLKLAKKSSKTTPLVLVYAAKDRKVNHANVLADWLKQQQ